MKTIFRDIYLGNSREKH